MIINELDLLSQKELQDKFLKLCYDSNMARLEFIEAENRYLALKGIKEEKLASLMTKEDGKSQKEKETKARLSLNWESFNQGLIDAECDRNLKKVLFSNFDREWETIRSLMSARNSELRAQI